MNISGLQQQFRGEIVTPASPDFDAARRIWNGMIDRRPACIARCTGPADVVAAVRFCAQNDLYPAVRAGGHNVAGLAMLDDGLVIDVSQMKGIQVDPSEGTATAQTGHTWGSFDRETQLHGLATTGGLISTTGIAGLTLGGGVGWLMGRFGATCDNTLAYEIVTADGAILTASEDHHPDLFWALKGGGGNFGVVTSIKYRIHPVSVVISGMILHPLSRAAEVLRFYREFVSNGLPDDVMVITAALTAPDGAPVLAIVPCYCGTDLSAGEKLLEPLRRFGPPVADLVTAMPYVQMQQMFDAAVPHGIRSYWKGAYLREVPDCALDKFAEWTQRCPSPRTATFLEHAHGAFSRVPTDATAFSLRSEPFDFIVLSLWDNPREDANNIEWTRGFFAAMQPWSANHVYVNMLSEDEGARIPQAYDSALPRLAEVKRKYDPVNRFRRNHNIRPAG